MNAVKRRLGVCRSELEIHGGRQSVKIAHRRDRDRAVLEKDHLPPATRRSRPPQQHLLKVPLPINLSVFLSVIFLNEKIRVGARH